MSFDTRNIVVCIDIKVYEYNVGLRVKQIYYTLRGHHFYPHPPDSGGNGE